jgi:hypothetical protein
VVEKPGALFCHSHGKVEYRHISLPTTRVNLYCKTKFLALPGEMIALLGPLVLENDFS